MSKPTFFQSVFHKPSRKYANSAAPASTPDRVASTTTPHGKVAHENSRLSLSEQQVLDAAYDLLKLKHSPYDADAHVLPTLASQSASGSLSSSLPTSPRASWDMSAVPIHIQRASSPTRQQPPHAASPATSAVGSSSTIRRRSTHTIISPTTMSEPQPSTSSAPISAANASHAQSNSNRNRLALRHSSVHVSPPADHASASKNPQEKEDSVELEADSDTGDDDVYYTPRSSPKYSPFHSPSTNSGSRTASASRESMTTAMATTTATVAGAASKLAKLPRNPHRVTWSSASSVTSSAPSSDDARLNNSSYAPSESTAPTSSTASASASSERQRKTSSSSRPNSAKRQSFPASTSIASEDSEWAKDVRWLVKPDNKAKPPPRSWTHEATGRTAIASSSNASSSSVLDDEASPTPPRRKSLDSPSDYLRDLQVPQRPPRHTNRTKSISSASSASSSSISGGPSSLRPRRNPQPITAATVSDTRLLRMSAVLEVEEEGNGIVIGTAHPSVLHRHVMPDRGGSVGRKRSLRARTSSDPSYDPDMAIPPRRASSVRSKSSSATTTYQTVELATTLAVSDGGEPSYTNGYTSLVLPRAAYTPGKNPISSKVDLTRGGLAQTTMSTISVIKGAATATSSRRRLSILGVGSLLSRTSSSATASAKRKGKSVAESALALTSNTPPPSKLQSGQILVQVSTVAVDGLDRLMVNEKCAKPDGYGFVPGRSFAGRVVEAGWEVTAIQKGDWVIGLLEFNRSGALAEFIVVDRRRVCCVPSPNERLTVEQMALLPLIVLQSSRAARSMPRVRPKIEEEKNPDAAEPVNGKALVLGAQSAVGTMVVRQLRAMGVNVMAHVLPRRSRAAWDQLMQEGSDGTDYEDLEVIEDNDVERAMGRLPDSTFKLIVDTVGGKGAWKVARRVLDADGGQYTTTVGDTPEVIPTRNAHVKGNMRSLRHAFGRKDDKAVGYIWICPAVDVDHDGEDVRDTLKAVTNLAARGICVPHVERVVPFERTPSEVFGGDDEEEDGVHARPVVIRVIG
ncbi:hypothetical protein FRB98_007170 [Tulasnella sp. 332]|nr:hypothetical protein FRB98_007170 [Tulasnella sp. 332]